MKQQGFVVWFTGLPSSGKSTLANTLCTQLRCLGYSTEILDGDEIRKRLTSDLGFSKEDRNENVRRISYVANLLAKNGIATIVSAISPYRDGRDEARKEIQDFVEVYVKCDLKTCISRDVKGLYKRALRNEISNFTGISDPYQAPLSPEVVVETDREEPSQSTSKVMRALIGLGYTSNHNIPSEQGKEPIR